MTIDVWEILSIVGSVAFALSGAIVAMEEDFDLLGIFILGFVTAFGGGAIRNVLIGLPISALWSQGQAFHFAFAAMILLIFFPKWVGKGWMKAEVLTDAIGLAAFSVQGALYAVKLHQPLSAVIVAAVLTGAGGGVVRDVLAGRKPSVLRSEIYAGWSILAALLLYFKIAKNDPDYYLLVLVLTCLRMIGYWRQWHLPKIKWKVDEND
ncbi:MAG: trimeric intracellular cation channel family protein [Streptococcus orisratti]|uniref:trimeric intracellular cation channel family protein n=1 Tax=Streptococcus orisratti TaxID=114652 RepID=UPI00235591E0|nr:trimeric intracellular cation channel family protein [Streptococcus orisratti]MCI7676754.1 trimeric intracellular cation channel family protein [Streptococcus orisratti]MDY4001145.1 trimeric intracellular cation channel family protein [Streptococcus orisratti]MDY5636692.1 trimeric intracellular cation channel family protein [Streptococcus orisratti]